MVELADTSCERGQTRAAGVFVKQQDITPTFGTLIEGLDLAELGPPMARRLYETWQRRHLLVLRRQPRGAAARLAATLGEFQPITPCPPGETPWDADLSSSERPPFACVMHCVEAPAQGGATWFASLPAALRSMAPDLAARLHWLALQHRDNVHPMVIMQPETGEHTLYLGARSGSRIPGVPQPESERLLNIVWSYATAASVTLCHHWQAGDLVLWNNLTIAHRHDAVPAGSARVLEGLRVKCRYTLSAPIQQEAA
jgi:taurine dioxygenase